VGDSGKGSRICARTESEYVFLAPSFWVGERETCDWVRRMGVFAALCLINSGFYTMELL
jgi:hypothetical protein